MLDPSVATWAGQGWNVIQITATMCAAYFQSNSNGSDDPFQTAIASLNGTKTVFYAPTCDLSYSNTQTFKFAADVVLQVKTLTTANSDTYKSTSSTRHDFSLLASAGTACSTANTDVSFSNSSNFDPSLTVFVYTPGQVSYQNSPSMTGQILGCGGLVGANAFTLTLSMLRACSH